MKVCVQLGYGSRMTVDWIRISVELSRTRTPTCGSRQWRVNWTTEFHRRHDNHTRTEHDVKTANWRHRETRDTRMLQLSVIRATLNSFCVSYSDKLVSQLYSIFASDYNATRRCQFERWGGCTAAAVAVSKCSLCDSLWSALTISTTTLHRALDITGYQHTETIDIPDHLRTARQSTATDSAIASTTSDDNFSKEPLDGPSRDRSDQL